MKGLNLPWLVHLNSHSYSSPAFVWIVFVSICSKLLLFLHKKNPSKNSLLFLWPLCFMNAVNCFYEWKIKSLLYTNNCSEIKNLQIYTPPLPPFKVKSRPLDSIVVLAKNTIFPQEFSSGLQESTLLTSGRLWTLLSKKQWKRKPTKWIKDKTLK